MRARTLGRRSAVGAVVASAAVCLSGCGFLGIGSGPASIDATAVFSDVSNLASGAPVQYADVTVGHVSSITLDGSKAKVVMSIERSADVPADVTAEVAQATILGEEVIELVAPSPSGHVALLADGATIRRAVVVPGVEQLVQAGTAVIGAIGTSQLAELVQTGAQAFGGQGPTLRKLLSDLDTISTAYASRDGEIKSLIGDLDELGASLAPNASSDADAIANLAKATTVLAANSSRFEQLLGSLDQLAIEGRGILETYLPGLNLQLLGLDKISAALAERQQDIGLLLQYLPGHDKTLSSVVRGDFVQIVNDLIVCGLPLGGSNAQTVNACPSNGG